MASRQVKFAKVRGSGSVTLRGKRPNIWGGITVKIISLVTINPPWSARTHFLAAWALMPLLTFSHPASSRHTSATMDLVPQ